MAIVASTNIGILETTSNVAVQNRSASKTGGSIPNFSQNLLADAGGGDDYGNQSTDPFAQTLISALMAVDQENPTSGPAIASAKASESADTGQLATHTGKLEAGIVNTPGVVAAQTQSDVAKPAAQLAGKLFPIHLAGPGPLVPAKRAVPQQRHSNDLPANDLPGDNLPSTSGKIKLIASPNVPAAQLNVPAVPITEMNSGSQAPDNSGLADLSVASTPSNAAALSATQNFSALSGSQNSSPGQEKLVLEANLKPAGTGAEIAAGGAGHTEIGNKTSNAVQSASGAASPEPRLNGVTPGVTAPEDSLTAASNRSSLAAYVAPSQRPKDDPAASPAKHGPSSDNFDGVLKAVGEITPNVSRSAADKPITPEPSSKTPNLPIDQQAATMQSTLKTDLNMRLQAQSGENVNVRLAERGGEIQLSIRSTDQVAVNALRHELPSLQTALQGAGWHMETAASAQNKDAGSESQGNPGKQDQNGGSSRGDSAAQHKNQQKRDAYDQWFDLSQ